MDLIIPQHPRNSIQSMAMRFFVRLLLRSDPDDLIFEVRETDSDRLAARMSYQWEFDERAFFWFDIVDGRSVIVNLAAVKVARFVWDPSSSPSDLLRDEGSIEIVARPERVAVVIHHQPPTGLWPV